MSIKGIDTQIMIQRSTDFARDTSNILKHPETAQEFLATQTKINSAQEQSRVAATTETENEEIRTDVDGGSGGEYSGGGGSDEEDEEFAEEQRIALLVPPSQNIIDITI